MAVPRAPGQAVNRIAAELLDLQDRRKRRAREGNRLPQPPVDQFIDPDDWAERHRALRPRGPAMRFEGQPGAWGDTPPSPQTISFDGPSLDPMLGQGEAGVAAAAADDPIRQRLMQEGLPGGVRGDAARLEGDWRYATSSLPGAGQRLEEMEGEAGFDVNAARRAGYSFSDIADYLAPDSGFDVQGARDAGYDDAEIVSYITRGKGFSPSGLMGTAVARGVWGGLADLAGMTVGGPLDAMNWAMRQAGVPNLRGEPLQPLDAMGAPRRALAQTTLPGASVPMTYESLEDLPPHERPFAVGGEALGATLPIAAAPLVAARAGAQGGSLLRPILERARQRPGQFAAAEAGAAAGAAQAGGLAEVVRPGDPLTRMGAEMAGAFVNPLGTLTRLGGAGVRQVRDAARSFTETGRQAKAAEALQGALREAGEDPAAVARALSEPDVVPTVGALTAGQKTGSPTLLAVEAKLKERSPAFAGAARKRADEAFAGLRTAIDDLTRSGRPEDLRQAAQLRERYFSELLGRRFAAAKQEADRTAARIGEPGRAQAQEASIEATQTVRQALRDARSVETQLWSAIDKNVPIRAEGLTAAHASVRGKLLKEEKLDGVTEGFLKRVAPMARAKKPPDTPSSGEMLRFRQHVLAQGRKAQAEGNNDIRLMYDELASAVLDDLDQVPGTATQAARQYTRALHDAFSRTFAGDALAVTRTGARRIPPEVMLERGFGAGGNVADVRFRQLVDAAGFGPIDLSPRMASAQERFIRVMASETRDRAGRIDPQKLQRFVRDNASLLERFPGLRAHLTDAASAERLFRDVEAATSQASRAIANKAAFARLTQSEDPARVVGDAMRSRTPMQDYQGLARVARRGGPSGVAGLKSATLEHATRQATGPDGRFSFARFSQALEGSRGQPGAIGVMQRNMVMSGAEADRLRRIVREAEKIEGALTTQARIDELLDAPDALLELVLRISGARMGTMAAQQGQIGHGLIAAHAGSKFMRNLFQRVPVTRTMDVLEAAAKDRSLMSALLTRPTSIGQARQLERQINAALIQAGVTADLSEMGGGEDWSGTTESGVHWRVVQ